MADSVASDGRPTANKYDSLLPERRGRFRFVSLSLLQSALALVLVGLLIALPQATAYDLRTEGRVEVPNDELKVVGADLSCRINDEGVLPASCFRWVSYVVSRKTAFDTDRLARTELVEKYARTYEGMSGAKKKIIRKECSAHDDDALRGYCYGSLTCAEAGGGQERGCEWAKVIYESYMELCSMAAGDADCGMLKIRYAKNAAMDGNHICEGILALSDGWEALRISLETDSLNDDGDQLRTAYTKVFEGLDLRQQTHVMSMCCSDPDVGSRVMCYLVRSCLEGVSIDSEAALPWCSEMQSLLLESVSDDGNKNLTSIKEAIEKTSMFIASISGGSEEQKSPEKKRRNRKVGRVPPPPCMDLNPSCPDWARDGECSFSPEYMYSNCPQSCDHCNSALTSLHRGVEQHKRYPEWSSAGQIGALASYTNRGELLEPTKRKRSAPYLGTRVQEVTVAMEAYLDSATIKGAVIPQTCSNRHSHCALWAARGLCDVKRPTMQKVCPAMCHVCERLPLFIDGDDAPPDEGPSTAYERMDMFGIFEAIEEDRVIIPPTLKTKGFRPSDLAELVRREKVDNLPLRQIGFMVYRLEASKEALDRVRKRRRWAQRGILPVTRLEEQRRKVKKIGKEIVSIKQRKDANTIISEQTIVEANELAEKMENMVGAQEREAIAKEREEVVSNLKVLQKKSSVLSNEMQDVLESQRLLLKQSLENQSQLKKEAAVGGGSNDNAGAGEGWGKNYADGPIIARFDKLLSPTECHELLALVRNGKSGNDGFPKETMEMMTESGMARPVRVSSRIFVDPTASAQNNAQHSSQSEFDLVNPILQRLLAKVEMITSIPAAAHAEMPILFEKFGRGDFEGPKSHFGDLSSLPVTGKDMKKKVSAGSASHPMAMRNARVMKMMIFLSDVEEGGEIAFPGMGNFAIEPLIGRALLVPSVLSLVGENIDGMGLSLVDDPLVGKEPDKRDSGTCLVEDMDTVSEHRRVEEGTKYVLTVWLRRFPVR